MRLKHSWNELSGHRGKAGKGGSVARRRLLPRAGRQHHPAAAPLAHCPYLTQVVKDVHLVAMLHQCQHSVAACAATEQRGVVRVDEVNAADEQSSTVAHQDSGNHCSEIMTDTTEGAPMKPTPPVTKMLPLDIAGTLLRQSVERVVERAAGERLSRHQRSHCNHIAQWSSNTA